MNMTAEKLIVELISKNYVVKLGEDNYVITNLMGRDNEEEEKVKEVVLPSPAVLLRNFIRDCNIPFRAKTSTGGFYELASESEYAKRALYAMLSSHEYKYEDIVAATNAYYTNVNMARVTLTNYFKNGTIRRVMEEYTKHSDSLSLRPKANKVSL